MKRFMILSATVFLTATLAHAVEFEEIDQNVDGYLSYEELKMAMPDVTEEQFKSIDFSLDGQISKDEFAAAELQ